MNPAFYPTTTKRLKPSLHPRKGFRFKDDMGVTHVGSTLVMLVESVRRYRARLGKPPGDPMVEVTEYLCKSQPELCTDNVSGKPIINTKALVGHVVHDITAQFRRGKIELATPEEIQRRADICVNCPFAIDWSKICGSCQNQAAGNVVKILAPTKPHPALVRRCCLQARDDLSLAAARKDPREVAEAPDNCWRKET